MSEAITNKIRDLIYSNPRTHLSLEDLQFLDSLSTDIVSDILYEIYTTETCRDINAKIYQAILELQNIDKVQFFINAYDSKDSGHRTTCCQTLGDFPDSRAITKLCQIFLEDPDPSVRYFAIEAVTHFGDETVLPLLAYVRDHDTDVDYEEVPVADTAQWAINTIHRRISAP
jgi:HEAT repeat protein